MHLRDDVEAGYRGNGHCDLQVKTQVMSLSILLGRRTNLAYSCSLADAQTGCQERSKPYRSLLNLVHNPTYYLIKTTTPSL